MKMSLYGPAGSGKTLTTLLFSEGLARMRGKRIAYVDTENGTKSYTLANPARACHPEAFDFDILRTRSLAETLQEVRSLDPDIYGVVVIDSITHLWEAAREAWESRHPNDADIPLRAWGSIKRPYKDLIKLLINSPFDVFIVGRQKSIFEEENGKLSNVGVGMKAEGETQYEPDICLRFEQLGRRGERPTISCFAEKDRYSILSGNTYTNPTYATIEPLVPFIGSAPPPAEDEDERLARDGELQEAGSDKAEKKAEKSRSLLLDFQAKFQTATTLEEVGAIAADLKKQKRYMLEDHLNAMRQLYESIRDRVVAATAGTV